MQQNEKIIFTIVDYGMGNLFSVKRICDYIGVNTRISSKQSIILDSDVLILPGVGAFGDAINNLHSLDLVNPIKDHMFSGKPFMGICLGMQLLMTESEEFGLNKGFNIFEGRVIRFNKPGEKIKIPQIGWNSIKIHGAVATDKWSNTLLNGLDDGAFMYFVHSYYAVPTNSDVIISITNYEGIEFCSSMQQNNIFACQFHPEKSAINGIQIFKNFYEFAKKWKEVKSLR